MSFLSLGFVPFVSWQAMSGDDKNSEVVSTFAPELALSMLDPLRYLTWDVIKGVGLLDKPLVATVQSIKIALQDTTVKKQKRAGRASRVATKKKRVVVCLKPRPEISLRTRAAVAAKRHVSLRSRADVAAAVENQLANAHDSGRAAHVPQ